MTNHINKTSLRTAALIAGLGLLVMVIAAPFAELFVLPKLIVPHNAAETAKKLLANKTLFVSCIFGYLITFICDVVVAWALYILLKPTNSGLSLLTALFRWVYTVIAIVSLLNLINVFWLLNNADYLIVFNSGQLNAQLMLFIKAFRSGFNFGIIFFSIHLLLLGYLAFKSNYIPGIFGVLLIVTGLGYLVTSIEPYLFPTVNVDFAKFTFYGELIFMLWLIIRGSRLKEP